MGYFSIIVSILWTFVNRILFGHTFLGRGGVIHRCGIGDGYIHRHGIAESCDKPMFTFWRTTSLFSKATVPFGNPTNSILDFSTLSPQWLCSVFWQAIVCGLSLGFQFAFPWLLVSICMLIDYLYIFGEMFFWIHWQSILCSELLELSELLRNFLKWNKNYVKDHKMKKKKKKTSKIHTPLLLVLLNCSKSCRYPIFVFHGMLVVANPCTLCSTLDYWKILESCTTFSLFEFKVFS